MIECEYTIDKMCSDSTESNINMTVPWYLMASYAYYVQDDPIISDRLFDLMGKRMLENWDKIEHFHKSYIKKDYLEAGTFLGEYPSRVEGGVKVIRDLAKKAGALK